MAEFKMSRNGSGYYDDTAYKGITQLAKPGEIWDYTTNNGIKQTYLIIKNHDTFCSALKIVEEANEHSISILDGKYTDPRMVQYIYNSNVSRRVGKISDEQLQSILAEVGVALALALPDIPREGIEYPDKLCAPIIDDMIMLFGERAVKCFLMCNAYKYRYLAGGTADASQYISEAILSMEKLKELGGGMNG